jgi:acyl-CoA thioesterase-1
MADSTHWVGTWTAAPAPAEGAAFSNHTLRMIPRVSLGGSRVRVRISNAYGVRPLAIGAAFVGLRSAGPAVAAGSNRRLTFGGDPTATIAAGAVIVSDPVDLAVPPLSDLAVSVYLPEDLPASFGITGRYARQTNYISPPGNFSASEAMPVGKLTDDWYFVCGVDVVAPSTVGAVVALGDSLTAGFGLGAEAAFPTRLQAALEAKGYAVEIANAGVSGDTASGGLARLDWSVPEGTEAVILELGANDALRGIDPAITRAALDTILKRLAERRMPVLLAGMRAPPNMGADYAGAFDAIFPALAAAHDVVFYPFFLDGVAAERKLNLADGMHPTAAGVDVIVNRILPKAEELVARAKAKRNS